MPSALPASRADGERDGVADRVEDFQKGFHQPPSPERAAHLVSPFQGFGFFLLFPGRCPGLACLRTFGARSRSMPKCMTGSKRGVYPIVKLIGPAGLTTLPKRELAKVFRKHVA